MKQFKLALHQAVLSIIGEKSTVYYFYHDWSTEKENKLHRGNCEHCVYGIGRMIDHVRGENGVWIGPFDSAAFADIYIFENKLSPHPRCDRGNPCLRSKIITDKIRPST